MLAFAVQNVHRCSEVTCSQHDSSYGKAANSQPRIFPGSPAQTGGRSLRSRELRMLLRIIMRSVVIRWQGSGCIAVIAYACLLLLLAPAHLNRLLNINTFLDVHKVLGLCSAPAQYCIGPFPWIACLMGLRWPNLHSRSSRVQSPFTALAAHWPVRSSKHCPQAFRTSSPEGGQTTQPATAAAASRISEYLSN